LNGKDCLVGAIHSILYIDDIRRKRASLTNGEDHKKIDLLYHLILLNPEYMELCMNSLF